MSSDRVRLLLPPPQNNSLSFIHYLFSYFEYTGSDFAADMAKLAADPTTQRWWEVCKPCHEPPRRPRSRRMVGRHEGGFPSGLNCAAHLSFKSKVACGREWKPGTRKILDLARFSHQISSRGGADGHGYKARDRGLRRRTRQYVEEPDRAQRGRHAWIRCRSRKPVRNAG